MRPVAVFDKVHYVGYYCRYVGTRLTGGCNKFDKVVTMDNQEEEKETTTTPQLAEGYTAEQAAEVMSRNSGKSIAPDYVRKLASKRLKLIRSTKVGPRLNLYNKEDVDGYKVEERGKKAGRAAQTRAKSKEEGEAA